MILSTRSRIAVVGVAVVGLVVTGCGTDSDSSAPQPGSAATSITVDESWVKAADTGMTAMFATVHNNSDTDLLLTEASSPAAPRLEIHEMAEVGGTTVMRRKQGGLAVPAHGSVALEPGGDHVMLFDLPAPVRAGSEVPFTLTFGAAGDVQVTSQVRDFTGARESYDEGAHGG